MNAMKYRMAFIFKHNEVAFTGDFLKIMCWFGKYEIRTSVKLWKVVSGLRSHYPSQMISCYE